MVMIVDDLEVLLTADEPDFLEPATIDVATFIIVLPRRYVAASTEPGGLA